MKPPTKSKYALRGALNGHGRTTRLSRRSGCAGGRGTAEGRLSQGEKIGKICRGLEISEHSSYRWRRLYGGLKVDQARRLKDLERENRRLKKAVSELTPDKLILKEALEGKY